MPKAKPGREYLVARDILPHHYIDANGIAVKRKLAKPPIYISAVRTLRKNRLLAMVVNLYALGYFPLRHPYSVSIIALNLLWIRRIGNERRYGRHRKHRQRTDRQNKERKRIFHFSFSSTLQAWRETRWTLRSWS